MQLVPALVLLVLAACGGGGEGKSTKTEAASWPGQEERLAQLEAELASTQSLPETWSQWYEELEAWNGEERTSGEFWLFSKSERVVYDEGLSRRLSDATVLDDPARQQGPLAMIVDFARQLEKAGIDLLMVPVPPRSAVFPERVGVGAPLAEGETPPRLDVNILSFLASLEQQGVEVVDTLPLFLARRFRDFAGELPEGLSSYREAVFRRHDAHWSSYGASLVAEQIGRRARAYPWFDQAARQQGRAVLEESVEWLTRRGNIGLRMESEGRLDPDTPKEHFPLHKVRIQGEGPEVVDDRDSPVLLIGDSYCLPDHGLPDQLLKQLGFRVDRVNISGGYVSSLLQSLRMRDDDLAGKRLVVWVFGYYSLNRWGQWIPQAVL